MTDPRTFAIHVAGTWRLAYLVPDSKRTGNPDTAHASAWADPATGANICPAIKATAVVALDRDAHDLDRLAVLSDKASPGPWYQSGAPWFRESDVILSGAPDPHVAAQVLSCDPYLARREGGEVDDADPDDDAAFIVALVNAYRDGALVPTRTTEAKAAP